MLRIIRSRSIHGGSRRRGILRRLYRRVQRLMMRSAHTGQYTVCQLRDRYAPMITVRRVQQILQAEPSLEYVRAVPVPRLLTRHRNERLEWARDMIQRGGRFWRRVFFSDESRFTLDGRDGLAAYWQDNCQPGRWFGCRQHGGGKCHGVGLFFRPRAS